MKACPLAYDSSWPMLCENVLIAYIEVRRICEGPPCEAIHRASANAMVAVDSSKFKAVNSRDRTSHLRRSTSGMLVRQRTIEHVFGTLKHWMGSAHFLMKTLHDVRTEMSLHVLAYNLKRVIKCGASRRR